MSKSLLPIAVALVLGVSSFLIAYQLLSPTEGNSLVPRTGSLAEGDQVLTLVVYHAEWCGPCRALSQTLHDSSVQDDLYNRGIHILSLDVDHDRPRLWKYRGNSIPAYALVRGTTVVREGKGYRSPADFRAWLAGQ